MDRNRDISQRKLARSADEIVIAGVCAGLADYCGFRPGITRILAVIALIIAPPVTAIAYLGATLLGIVGMCPECSQKLAEDLLPSNWIIWLEGTSFVVLSAVSWALYFRNKHSTANRVSILLLIVAIGAGLSALI